MKIMICHDGSQNAQNALEKTLTLFKSMKPEIILLTVVDEPHDASWASEEVFKPWKEARETLLREKAKEISSQGFAVDAMLATGDPRQMILEAAKKKNPDILIVGKRGAGRLPKMTLGSVSAFLVRHALCPVLIFH